MASILWIILGLAATTGYAKTYTFSGRSIQIPDVGPADPSLVYVEGIPEGVAYDLTVKINGMTHKYGGETMVVLSNSDGWSTLLWAAPYCQFESTPIAFNDNAERSMEDDCKRRSVFQSQGNYQTYFENRSFNFTIPIAPQRPFLASLNELLFDNVNGRWVLWVEDFYSGGSGSIESWDIIIETIEE